MCIHIFVRDWFIHPFYSSFLARHSAIDIKRILRISHGVSLFLLHIRPYNIHNTHSSHFSLFFCSILHNIFIIWQSQHTGRCWRFGKQSNAIANGERYGDVSHEHDELWRLLRRFRENRARDVGQGRSHAEKYLAIYKNAF